MSRFDIDLPDSRQIFLESLDVMVKAWTQDESFTYDGEFVKVNHPTTVWPKPLQKPHPKLWVAGTSVETMQLAGQVGHDAHYHRPAGRERRAVPPDHPWCTR